VDCFLHSPATAQITLSSVTFSFSVNKFNCCHAPYNKTLSLPLTVFCVSKCVCISLQMHFNILILLLAVSCFYYCILLVPGIKKKTFYTETVCRCLWRFYGSQLITNIENSPITRTIKGQCKFSSFPV